MTGARYAAIGILDADEYRAWDGTEQTSENAPGKDLPGRPDPGAFVSRASATARATGAGSA